MNIFSEQLLVLYLPLSESSQSQGKGKLSVYVSRDDWESLLRSCTLYKLIFHLQASHLLSLAKAKWLEAQEKDGKAIGESKEGQITDV